MSWFWVLFFLYWLPTLIAALRASPNAMAIFALNLLLGWTVLGWIIAFVWSLAAIQRAGNVSVHIANTHVISPVAPMLLDPQPPSQKKIAVDGHRNADPS